MKIAATLLAMLVLIPTASRAWIFGPSDENECRQDYVVKAKSHDAARVAVYACKFKFTKKPINSDSVRKWRANRKWADCVLDDVSSVETDLGAKQLSVLCRKN